MHGRGCLLIIQVRDEEKDKEEKVNKEKVKEEGGRGDKNDV